MMDMTVQNKYSSDTRKNPGMDMLTLKLYTIH